MKMRGIKDLEDDLEHKQDLYDKYDNNPHMQAKIAREISAITNQLKMWDKIYSVVGATRPSKK